MENKVGNEYIESIIKNDINLVSNDSDLCRKYSIDKIYFNELINDMVSRGTIILFDDGDKNYLIHRENLENIFRKIEKILSDYHSKNKFKIGFLKEKLRSLIFGSVKIKIYDKILKYFEDRKLIKLVSKYISLYHFDVEFTRDIQVMVDKIVDEYRNKKFIPPRLSDLENKFLCKNFNDIHNYLFEIGILYKVNHEMYLLREDFLHAKNLIVNFLKQNGSISLKEARGILDSNRKYLVFILEHLDELRITSRSGENRVLI